MYIGRMSWRRLRVLIDNLPPESRYLTAVRNSVGDEVLQELADQHDDDTHGPWSQTDMLLARIGDRIADLIWMKSDGKNPPPDPYPRPGVKAKSRRVSPEQVAYLREVERLRGGQPGPEFMAFLRGGDSDE